MTEAVAIIPARYGSTRFPGKVLADLGGKPVIRHVYERVSLSKRISRVFIATDDERIARAVEDFGGAVVMTSPDHQSGTSRVAEASRVTGGDIIVNVQGDEPLIEPTLIDAVIGRLDGDSDIVCSTAAFPAADRADYTDPHAVKVVFDDRGSALYFSRAPIPCYSDRTPGEVYIHVGIYCFRRDFLSSYATLEETPLERAEKLEQLRILEHGYRIGVMVTGHAAVGIDTEEDLERVRRLMEKQGDTGAGIRAENSR